MTAPIEESPILGAVDEPLGLGAPATASIEEIREKYTKAADQPLPAALVSPPLRPVMQRGSPYSFKLYREVRALSRQAS